MLKSILILIFLSFCIGTGAWLFFISAVKRGDFEDIEGAKYRMLDDDEEDPAVPKENDQNDPEKTLEKQ